MNNLNPLDTADIAAIVDEAKKQAQTFKNDKLKTNQIRNFYSAIAQIRIKFQEKKSKNLEGRTGYDAVKTDLIMLKPKLAYAAGRQAAVKANFYGFMTDAIKAVEDSKDMDKAMAKYFSLIESVVGYHKYFGDK